MVHQAVLWFQLLTNEWKWKKKKKVFVVHLKTTLRSSFNKLKLIFHLFVWKTKKKKEKNLTTSVTNSSPDDFPTNIRKSRAESDWPVESISGSSSSPQCILFPSTTTGSTTKMAQCTFPPPRRLSTCFASVSVTTARHRRFWRSKVRPEMGGVGGGRKGEVGVREVSVKGASRDSRNPAGGKPDPSKCLLMFHGKRADFIGALMGTCHW